MNDTEKIAMIKEELERAKVGKHKCSDPNCFISMALPLLELEGSFDSVADLVLFCYEQRQNLEKEGIVIGGEAIVDIEENQVKQAVDELLIFGENIKENSPMKKPWTSLVLSAQKNREAIKALIFFANFFVMLEKGHYVVKRKEAIVKAILAAK